MKLTVKQTKALNFLQDQITQEVYYGGAAGGGKSYFGCYWVLKWALKCEGSRWLIGRSELKNLKKTTLNSFFEVCKEQGLKAIQHYKYDQQASIIYLFNGSQIILADLFAYPSDPFFDSLGSLEITGAFIDEAPQVTERAKNIVKSRIRYKLDEFKRLPKMLMCGNPSKNWAYSEFYKPAQEGTLRADRQFIQALVTDNPYISQHYIESLANLDENSKQRLLMGNWEYDDDPSALIEYNKILECFTNDFDSLSGEEFITVDAARLGGDRIIVGHWKGWRVKLKAFRKQTLDVTFQYIEDLRKKRNIPVSRVLIDDDGIGGGLVDFGKYKGFVNNGRPLPNPITREPENYTNLKSQCSFMTAERVNNSGLYIEYEDIEMKNRIIEQMEQVKQWNMDKDGKKGVMPKDKVKEILGYSPDEWDTIMMKSYFELAFKFSVAVA